jgi:hypothetical protein
MTVTEDLANKNIPAAPPPQPPYSQDLSSSDTFLFQKLKNQLNGRHHGTLTNITNWARPSGNFLARSLFDRD